MSEMMRPTLDQLTGSTFTPLLMRAWWDREMVMEGGEMVMEERKDCDDGEEGW